MRKNEKTTLGSGLAALAAFAIFTVLVITVDVQPVGQNNTDIGFAALNCRFHEMTEVNMVLYSLTDWLGLVPILICIGFGLLGLIQLIREKSLFKVDTDLIILGVYYVVVIFAYLIFEMIPINFRPVLIDGFLEASYPSSTVLLVVCVMPTLCEQLNRRGGNSLIKITADIFTVLFSMFMIVGRLVSGVHWLTDIIGSILLGTGLYFIYEYFVLIALKRKRSVNFGIQ